MGFNVSQSTTIGTRHLMYYLSGPVMRLTRAFVLDGVFDVAS